jgi:hypothetical protein
VVLEQVCDALNYAHRRQTIHMDIKPSNIFLLHTEDGSDIVKVIDFGLARIMQSSVGTTLSHYRGTRSYSAPEVFRDQASHQSDIYSLGVMAFEMLSGGRPFNGSAEAVMRQHLFEPPPSLRRFLPEIPQLADDLIMRAMSKQPSSRPNTALVFREKFLEAVRWSETGEKHGLSNKADRSGLRLPTIRGPKRAAGPSRFNLGRPKRATRPPRLRLGQPKPPKGQRGHYVAGLFLSALRDAATWADQVLARLTRYYLNHRRRDLGIVLVLSLLIIVYPFPKLIGLPIERFHGALMFGTAFFLIGLDPRHLPPARLFIQRLALSIWLVSWSIVVTPPKLLGSNLSRLGGCVFLLSSFGCLCWTKKIKVMNKRVARGNSREAGQRRRSSRPRIHANDEEVVEIRPLTARIFGTISIVLGVSFALYAWLR